MRFDGGIRIDASSIAALASASWRLNIGNLFVRTNASIALATLTPTRLAARSLFSYFYAAFAHGAAGLLARPVHGACARATPCPTAVSANRRSVIPRRTVEIHSELALVPARLSFSHFDRSGSYHRHRCECACGFIRARYAGGRYALAAEVDVRRKKRRPRCLRAVVIGNE